MGWTNFIIVKDWKIIVETHRGVEGLDDYIEDALKELIDEDANIDVHTSELKVSDITVNDLCIMSKAYERASNLYDIDIDKLFLFWLESRGIKYEIRQGFNIDIKKYEEDGFKVIRIYGNDMDTKEEE